MSLQVLHVSNSDKLGGAQRAAYWLAKGLVESGIRSTYLVETKSSDESWIQASRPSLWRKLLSFVVEKLCLSLYFFSTKNAWSNNYISRIPFLDYASIHRPDIVNLHWIGGGFLSLHDIASIKTPLVISMYDMWFFTGGCHYSNSCNSYLSECLKCPSLNSGTRDLSSLNFLLKQRLFSDPRSITFVSPSSWLTEEARRSTILKNANIVTIPHGTDCNVFRPITQSSAFNTLNLDPNYRYLLFASTGGLLDSRKGYFYLSKALKLLRNFRKSTKLLILGPDNPHLCNLDDDFPFVHIRPINDDKMLATIYSAAHMVVTPSGQEAFGMTASESLCCGTPVVAFRQYGPLDVVTHKLTGYLANPYDPADLAAGIAFILDHPSYEELSSTCRSFALKRFSLSTVSDQYRDLYVKLTNSH